MNIAGSENLANQRQTHTATTTSGVPRDMMRLVTGCLPQIGKVSNHRWVSSLG